MKKNTVNATPQHLLEKFVADGLRYLENLGYSEHTLSKYRRTWNAMLDFSCQDHGAGGFSEDLATRFLSSNDVPIAQSGRALSSQKRHIRAAVRILSEFSQHGHFRRRRCTSEDVSLSQAFQRALQGYEMFCRCQLDHRPRTISKRKLLLTEFLHFLNSKGLQSISSIQPTLLSQFISSRDHLKSATKATFVSAIRSFLRYLFMQELLSVDLSSHVPKIRNRRDEHIPAVWTRDEVDALLDTVDRDSPQGKRDFAILILASRLGMRVGDIRNLCLEHILWKESRIEFCQSKTGDTLVLPISEEVGCALIDYLRYGRPVSPYREVFLRLLAPIKPFASNDNLNHIIALHRDRAGIPTSPSRQGMHSLRHTVASRLLDNETPISTIADILGHRSTESTRDYLKIDINALRSAVLDPQEVLDA